MGKRQHKLEGVQEWSKWLGEAVGKRKEKRRTHGSPKPGEMVIGQRHRGRNKERLLEFLGE